MTDYFQGVDQQPDYFQGVSVDGNGSATASPQVIPKLSPVLAGVNTLDPGSPADQIYQNLSGATKSYSDMMKLEGDLDTRTQIAAQQKSDSFSKFVDLYAQAPGFDPTGEIQLGAEKAAQHVLQEDVQSRAEYAMEQGAIKKIQELASAGSNTQAELLLNNMEHGAPGQILSDLNTKQLILQREIDKAGINVDDQSWAADAIDFIAGMHIPFLNTPDVGNVDIDEGLKHWYDGVFGGYRINAEAQSLWALPPASFAKTVREELIPNVLKSSTFLGYTNQTQELNTLTKFQKTPSALEQNSWDNLDNLGLVPFAKVSKLAQLPLILVKNGARKEAAGLVANAAREIVENGTADVVEKTGMTAQDVQKSLLPTALDPEADLDNLSYFNARGEVYHGPEKAEVEKTVVPVQEAANGGLSKAQAILDGAQLIGTGRLTEEETQNAVDHLVKQASDEFDRPLKDVQVRQEKLSDGSTISHVSMTVGKKGGDGFSTSSQLTKYMNSLSYSDWQAVQDASGQWFGKIERPVTETGFYTNALEPKASNYISRYVLSARSTSDKILADQAQMAGNNKNRILKGVVKPLADQIHSINNAQRESLAHVLTAGEQQGRWWSKDEFSQLYDRAYNRQPTVGEWQAYNAVRDLNDIEFILRNDDLYKRNVTRGMETVSFDTGIGKADRLNGFVKRDFSSLPARRTYVIGDDVHLTKPLTDEEVAGYRGRGFIHITTQEPIRLADDTIVNSFLARPEHATIESLRHDQLAYREGGHRIYSGKHFVKQAVSRVQGDTAHEILMSPNTYVATETRAEAKFWADHMEQARQAYNGAKSKATKRLLEARLDDILGGNAGLPSGREFIDAIEKGLYEKNTPFEVLYDRELPAAYSNVDPDALTFSDPHETGTDAYLRTNGRMYYSSKGDQLKDYQGNLAQVLDPYKTLNQAINNVSTLSSFSDYKQASVERWVETFKPYLNLEQFPSTASAMRIFNDAVPSNRLRQMAGGDRIKQGLEAQRDVIRRNLGWRSEYAIQKDQYARNLAEWIGGDDVDNKARQTAEKAINWWNTKSPISTLRGLAADAKLGLFNIGQMPLQMSTMIATMAIGGPTKAMHAMMTLLPLRAYLTKSGSEDLLNELVKRGAHFSAGFETADEFKNYMRIAKTSGFFDFGGTHQLINSYGPNAALGDVGNSLNSVRQAGRFFFNEAEMWNRMTALRVAWDDAKALMPKASTDSPEFRSALAGKAEDYSLRMSEQSKAAWQNGIASIPTQFWAYNARMFELMFGKTLTAAQRTRLIISQLAIAGTAGLPVLSTLSDLYQTSEGVAYPPDSFKGLVTRGLLDSVVYKTTGADLSIGKRYGTGNFLDDTVKSLFGVSQYGEKSTADMLGGATGSIVVQTLGQTGTDIVKWAIAESGGQLDDPVTRDDWIKMASQVSTVGNSLKAYMLFKYHTYQSNSQSLVATDLPTVDAFGAALGLAPAEVDYAGKAQQFLKNKKDAIDQAAQQISSFRARAWAQPDNYKDYMGQINSFVKLLPDTIRSEAIRKANQYTPQSFYDSVSDRMQKEKVQQQRLQLLEQDKQ